MKETFFIEHSEKLNEKEINNIRNLKGEEHPY